MPEGVGLEGVLSQFEIQRVSKVRRSKSGFPLPDSFEFSPRRSTEGTVDVNSAIRNPSPGSSMLDYHLLKLAQLDSRARGEDVQATGCGLRRVGFYKKSKLAEQAGQGARLDSGRATGLSQMREVEALAGVRG